MKLKRFFPLTWKYLFKGFLTQQVSKSGKRLHLVPVFSLVFVLFYIATYVYGDLYIDIYSQRDIMRAIGWLKGDIYWPGPEMSFGDNLPGPFFYFLLFPPLLLGGGGTYTSILIWKIIWLALTYTAAFHFASRICKHKESLFIFVMFLIACIGPSLFLPIIQPNNASFSVMFHLLAIIALYTWKDTGYNRYLYFLGLIVGFGVQVHALLMVHIFTALILWVMTKKKSWKPILWFILLALLPCLPHLIMHNLWLKTSNYYIIDNLKLFSINGVSLYNIDVITSFRIYLIGPVFLCLFLLLYQIRVRKIFPLSHTSIQLFIILTIPVAITIFLAENPWYLLFIPLFFMLLFTKLCDDLMPDGSNKTLNYLIFYTLLFTCPLLKNIWTKETEFLSIYSLITVLLLALICLASAIPKTSYRYLGKIFVLLMMSSLHIIIRDHKNLTQFNQSLNYPFISYSTNSFDSHYTVRYTKSKYHYVKPVLKQIALDTNWKVETAIKRAYLVSDIIRHISLSAYYSLTKEHLKKELKQSLEKLPEITGYFIIQHLKKFTDYTKADWKKYLSHSPYVSSFVQEEIKTGKLLLQNPKLYHQHWLIPYQLTKASIFPEGFYNIGQPYSWEEPHWLKTCPSTKNFTHNKYDLYYCMILPGHLQRAGVHITLSKETHRSFLEVSLFGPLLGLKVINSNIDGFAYWSDIQISLSCNNNKYAHPIPNIGYNPNLYSNDIMAESVPLSSPLKLKLPIDCKKEDISKISLRFKHQKIRLWYTDILPPPEQKEIIWHLL